MVYLKNWGELPNHLHAPDPQVLAHADLQEEHGDPADQHRQQVGNQESTCESLFMQKSRVCKVCPNPIYRVWLRICCNIVPISIVWSGSSQYLAWVISTWQHWCQQHSADTTTPPALLRRKEWKIPHPAQPDHTIVAAAPDPAATLHIIAKLYTLAGLFSQTSS